MTLDALFKAFKADPCDAKRVMATLLITNHMYETYEKAKEEEHTK